MFSAEADVMLRTNLIFVAIKSVAFVPAFFTVLLVVLSQKFFLKRLDVTRERDARPLQLIPF
jgi:hypothetical protein